MKLPLELDDRYLKEVLSNTSLKDLPHEDWKVVTGFEGYAISNYGRIKSLERWAVNPQGIKRKIIDSIKKPHVFKYFNKYVGTDYYNVRCTLSSEGIKYGKSVARLVYYHFIENFNMGDKLVRISYKDGNSFHVHAQNLEKLSVSEIHFKSFKAGRGNKGNYEQPVIQYTVDGKFVDSFENIYAASHKLGISHVNILQVINKIRLTAAGFQWFLKDYQPKKDDFIPPKPTKADKILNTALWKRLGKPIIDKRNPPACMNLSSDNLPDEKWKPVPGAEKYFLISDKGRIKRLHHWTQGKHKFFLREKIIPLLVDLNFGKTYLYTNLTYNGKKIQVRINRFLYYSFVKTFELKDRGLSVVNHNDPIWDIQISKLELCSATAHLKRIM